jgi:broad specificity phosphatase PhoE
MREAAMRSILLVVALLLSYAGNAYSQKAVIVVRHAERADDSKDTRLSAQGIERAKSLARVLRDAEISAVYVTQYRRTLETAEPVMKNRNLKPVAVPSDDVAGLVRKVRSDHAGQVVLIVGHSDTVPDIIQAFGYLQPVTVETSEFDNLFIVVPQPAGPPTVIRLRY